MLAFPTNLNVGSSGFGAFSAGLFALRVFCRSRLYKNVGVEISWKFCSATGFGVAEPSILDVALLRALFVVRSTLWRSSTNRMIVGHGLKVVRPDELDFLLS